MMSTSDASVVDFPDPVGPVTRTRPCRMSVKDRIDSGMPSTSKGGISWGIDRKAAATVPRCWNTLSRNRPTSTIEWEVSSSFSASKRSRSVWGRIPKTMSRIVSLSSTGQPSMGRIAPCNRMHAGNPVVTWRSEAPTLTA